MPRKRLPQRRQALNLNFRCKARTFAQTNFEANLGFYDDNSLGEIFLRCGKSGTEIEISMMESALLASFALQWGVPIEAIRGAMPRNTEGIAEGPIGTLFDLLHREGVTLDSKGGDLV